MSSKPSPLRRMSSRNTTAKPRSCASNYFQSERLQGTNSAWMSLYFTCTLGVILWFGGWEVIRGHLTAGGLTQFILYMNQLAFPIRQAARVIDSLSRAISSGQRLFEVLDAQLASGRKTRRPKRWDGRGDMCASTTSPSPMTARIPALTACQH